MPLGKFLLSGPFLRRFPMEKQGKKEFSRKNIPTHGARKDEGKCPETAPIWRASEGPKANRETATGG
jgi:hypothetical protein